MSVDKNIQDLATRISKEEGLDPSLTLAVIETESSGNPRAQSDAGAKGLMQLMGGISQKYGVQDPFDPEQNIRGGVKFLKELRDQYGNDAEALAHYNGGPDAVKFFRSKGGFFTDSTKPLKAWSNQTGNYVKKVLGRAGFDTSKIPEVKQDEVTARRRAGEIPSIASSDLTQRVGSKKKGTSFPFDLNRPQEDSAGSMGMASAPLQGQISLPSQATSRGIHFPDLGSLFAQPAQAAENNIAQKNVQTQLAELDAAVNKQELPELLGNQNPQIQETLQSLESEVSGTQTPSLDPPSPQPPRVEPGAPTPGILETVGQNLVQRGARVPTAIGNAGIAAVNEFIPSEDPTQPTIQPITPTDFRPTGLNEEELIEKRPVTSFVSSAVGDVPEFALASAGARQVFKGLVAKEVGKRGAGLLLGAPVATAITIGSLVSLFNQLGEDTKQQSEIRREKIGNQSLPGGAPTVEELASLPPVGGYSTVSQYGNKVEAITEGVIAASDRLFPGAKAVVKGGVAGVKSLKNAPGIVQGIVTLPKTIYEAFTNQLNTDILKESEKVLMYDFINEFNERLAQTETVLDLRQSIKSVLRRERKKLKTLVDKGIPGARKLRADQKKVVNDARKEFLKAWKEYIQVLEGSGKLPDSVIESIKSSLKNQEKQILEKAKRVGLSRAEQAELSEIQRQIADQGVSVITKEALKELEERVLQTQQDLIYNASKFGLSREMVRNSVSSMRLAAQKIQALDSVLTKLRNFGDNVPSSQVMFTLNSSERRQLGKPIARKTEKRKEEAFATSGREGSTGIDLANQSSQLKARVNQLASLENRIRNLQFSIEDELANNPPIGKTRQEFDVIMNELDGLAQELGLTFEKTPLKKIKELEKRLNTLEKKAEKKGTTILNLEKEIQATMEEVANYTAAITEKSKQSLEPERFTNNMHVDLEVYKDALSKARDPSIDITSHPGSILHPEDVVVGLRTFLSKQLVNVRDSLSYLQAIGHKGAKEVNLLTRSFDHKMRKGKIVSERLKAKLQDANLKSRTVASNLLAKIQRHIGTDEILLIETESDEAFGVSKRAFINKFKGKIPLLGDPGAVKELTRERVRLLQEVVQKTNPELARLGGFDRFGVRDPYFFEQAGRIQSANIAKETMDRLTKAFNLKTTDNLSTDVIKQYALKRQGVIKDEELVEDFVVGNLARIDAAYYKDAVESMYASFSKMLESGEVSEDLAGVMYSVVAQLSKQAKERSLLSRQTNRLLNVVSGGFLNTPSFVAQDLLQGINSVARYSKNPKTFTRAGAALLNPVHQREVIQGLINLGVYDGNASRELLSKYTAGERGRALQAFESIFNELGQKMDAGIDTLSEGLGQIARQDPKAISSGIKKGLEVLGENPLIQSPEAVLKTLTGTLALFDKYGDDTLNVVRTINKLGTKQNKFTRAKRGELLARKISKEGVPIKPSDPQRFSPVGKTVKEKLQSIQDDAFEVVNDAIDEDLFINSEFNSLLSSQSSIFRFSNFAFRQTAYQLKLLATDPKSYAKFLQLQLIAGGSQAVLPYVRNINLITSLAGLGPVVNEADFAETDKKLRGGLLPGSQILGQANNIFDIGVGNKVVPDILGLFPIETAALKEGFHALDSTQSAATAPDKLNDQALRLLPWFSALGNSVTGLKLPGFLTSRLISTFGGNPLASSPDKKKARLEKGKIAVSSSDGRHIEEVVISDFKDKIQLAFGVGKNNLFIRRYVGARGDVKDLIRKETSDLFKYLEATVDDLPGRKESFLNYLENREDRFFEQATFIDVFKGGSKDSKEVFASKQRKHFTKFREDQIELLRSKLSQDIEDSIFRAKHATNSAEHESLLQGVRRSRILRDMLGKIKDRELDTVENTQQLFENIKKKHRERIVF